DLESYLGPTQRTSTPSFLSGRFVPGPRFDSQQDSEERSHHLARSPAGVSRAVRKNFSSTKARAADICPLFKFSVPRLLTPIPIVHGHPIAGRGHLVAMGKLHTATTSH